MFSRRLKNELKNLPLNEKILGGGVALTLLSIFLPWYLESDLWGGNPEVYLGITGPLYLIGYIILAISGYSLYMFICDTLGKKAYQVLNNNDLFYVISGALTLFFNLLAYSIYFHNKFGVNIMTKEVRFGMVASFLGASLMVVCGYIRYVKYIKDGQSYYVEAEKKEEVLFKTPSTPHRTIEVPEMKKEQPVNLRMNL